MSNTLSTIEMGYRWNILNSSKKIKKLPVEENDNGYVINFTLPGWGLAYIHSEVDIKIEIFYSGKVVMYAYGGAYGIAVKYQGEMV